MMSSLKNTLIVVLTLLLGICAFELGLRALDGYTLFNPQLRPVKQPPAAGDTSLARQLAERLQRAPDADPAWFAVDPPPLPNRAAPSEAMSARYWGSRGSELAAVYDWNINFLQKALCTPGHWQQNVEDVFVFDDGDGASYPRFRFKRDITYPSGLVTNQFGWRGRPIGREKAPRTIRIGFIGASTTVNPHGAAPSYPEYIETWLNTWAKARSLDVRFEVLNAGHEGQNSDDFAAIAEKEMRLLDVDMVIYYEGSNQFWPEAYVQWPDGRMPAKPQITFKTPGWLETHSAIGRRIAILNRVSSGSERPRSMPPMQWPADLDERNPDPAYPQLPSNLSKIVGDLERIRLAIQAEGGELVVSSFVWMVHDGMVLDLPRQQILHRYLNETFWPFTYAHMRRMADFQNRVFSAYAARAGLPFLDVAADYPMHADLFADAIHMTPGGIRLHAWVAFNRLLPLLKSRIEAGRLPRTPQALPDSYPAPGSAYPVKLSTLRERCNKGG
jgi:hypothetical protein